MQAQDAMVISYHFENESLKSAFQKLEQRFDLTFSYEEMAISNKIIQNAKVKDVGLEEAIKQMLQSQSLSFEVLNDQYIIIKLAEGEVNERPKDKLCGSLKDSLSNDALAFGNVWIKNSTIGLSTNQNGYFELSGDFSEKDTLLLQYLGYKVAAIPLSQMINKECKNVYLMADLIAIPNILIEDTAIELLRASASGDGFFFRPDQMSLLPGWGDNDVLRMAQLIPGVNSIDESAANLYIRGGTPDQNMILWDGIPIYHTGHMFGLFSAFNPASAKSVSVHTGGLSAKHGERISGWIDIQSKPSQLDSFELEVGVNLINAHAYLKVPILKGKSALALSGRRSYTDVIQSGTYQKFFNQISANGRIEENRETIDGLVGEVNFEYDTKFFFSDWSAKWMYDLGEESEVSLSVYEGQDRLDYSLSGNYYDYYIDSKDEVNLQNWGVNGQWKQKWSPQFLSEVKLTHSHFRNDYSFRASLDPNIAIQTRTRLTNRLSETSFQLNQTWKASPLNALNFGFQYSKKDLDFDILFDAFPDFESSETVQSSAELKTFYIDYDWNISERLAIDFGTRINFLSSFQEEFWEPRLSFDYQPFKWPLHLKASAGRFAQIVSRLILRNELGLGEQLWFLTTQDRARPAIEASEFTFGTWWEKNGWLFDVEYYYKRTSNLTSFILNENQNSNTSYDRGNAFAEGIDLLIKKKWKGYATWCSYSLAKVDFQFAQLAFGQPFPADHDQRHIFKWTHLVNLKNWEFSATWNYQSGRPYSIPTISESYSQEQEQLVYNLDYSAVNQKRLPAYHRLDLSVTYQMQSRKGHTGKIGLSVMNLYNRNNIFDRVFQLVVQEEEPNLISYDRPMLGLTPNLFLSFEW